jgi:hypothetical protein
MQANSGFKYWRKNKTKNKRANADANSGSVEEPTRRKTPPHPRLSYHILSSALSTVLKRPHPNLSTRALTLRMTSSPLTAHAYTPRFFRPCVTGSLTMISSEMFFSARCK